MPRFIDRTGQRFGKLVAIKRTGTNSLKKVLWLCRCDCGKEVNVTSGALVTGNTRSCGCIPPNFKHGGWKNASYNTWRAMMRRCYAPQDKDYKRYGAKGVSVCAHWHDYKNFVADMGEPQGDETLDRIDVYGNYNPENCRWAGVKVQCRNIRVRADSKTGVTGVQRLPNGKYMACITANKKKFYSACCSTLDEAITARKKLESIYWVDV